MVISDERAADYVQLLDYDGAVHVDAAQLQSVRKRQWYAPGTEFFVQTGAQVHLRYADQTQISLRGMAEMRVRETTGHSQTFIC